MVSVLEGGAAVLAIASACNVSLLWIATVRSLGPTRLGSARQLLVSRAIMGTTLGTYVLGTPVRAEPIAALLCSAPRCSAL